jgi:hypothetical protein
MLKQLREARLLAPPIQNIGSATLHFVAAEVKST